MLESKSLSHLGLVRECNEDSFICDEELGLWVVADGVGGNSHGEIASQLAVQTVERAVRQGNDLSQALVKANEVVIRASEDQADLAGMATTAIACHFRGHQFELAWVGDSRAYLLDAEGICQLSSDHNRANELFEMGEIGQDDIMCHPGQHELTQAIGQMTLDKIPKSLGELHEGDILLLCTDGLTGLVDDDDIYRTIFLAPSLEYASQSLLKQVLDKGASDNVTFSLIRFCEEESAIKASDFSTSKQAVNANNTIESNYRKPFDKKAYLKHCNKRPLLLGLIILSIAFLLLFL